jgi:hypothetical protein
MHDLELGMEEPMKSRLGFIAIAAVLAVMGAGAGLEQQSSGLTLRLSYETESDILSDFLSSASLFRVAKPGTIPANPLEARQLEITDGRYGKCLHIKNGWSVTKGTSNESGADLDLIVATLWGDWRNKPHYWGQGRIYGERGTVAFWVKAHRLVDDPLYPIFIQTSVAWGRKERDFLRIDGDREGHLSASVRDIFYQYHQVKSTRPVWINDTWQHIAVVYDQAYGIKIFHNGTCVATNWGTDAWWQTSLPGLFSPFLPESYFDEICLFDRPLDDDEVKSLYLRNEIPPPEAKPRVLDTPAQMRLLSAYGDVDQLVLPCLKVGREMLSLKQTRVADCHDEKLPAWWVMDGRYELAWPHPYLLFTFILGDADFHGEKVDIDLEPGENPNYLALEGVLDGIEVMSGKPGMRSLNRIVDLTGYKRPFFSTKIDLGGNSSLHFPMVKGYGTPPGLVDRGTLKFPLSKDIRLHEVHLWNAEATKAVLSSPSPDIVWHFPFQERHQGFDARYLDALLKLASPENRRLLIGSRTPSASDASEMVVPPLQSVHFLGPDLNPDLPIDKLRLRFSFIPNKDWDVLWISLRDPANPSRVWAKAIIRLEFPDAKRAHILDVEIDPIDLMLASEDRLWLELKFSNGGRMLTGQDTLPIIGVSLSPDRGKSLKEYSRYELIPARMQYIKEYNYQPWQFAPEQRNRPEITFSGAHVPSAFSSVSGQTQGINYWPNFGGPYDMWYPPEAVLRHDPENKIAQIYKALTGKRAPTYGGYNSSEFTRAEEFQLSADIPRSAPAWAVWQREMYKRQLKTISWIIGMQRDDGMFWGGSNDDTFIPLGYAGIPLMGDQTSARSFLKLYDGLEAFGIFKDGYCDIWPIDYLHITDFLTSRGLLVPFALGNPHVLEREMITAKVYDDIMKKTNAERAQKGLPAYSRSKDSSREEPKLWAESLVRDYEKTQVLWYWGKTPKPEAHQIIDKNDIARRMMAIALHFDSIEEYDCTRAFRHTDRQGGAPGRNELITSALGGKLPGRIEPLPHSMVVSWDNPDRDLSRLVTYGSTQSVRINLYNFKDTEQHTKVRLWQIPKGIYSLRIGPDQDDDGIIDEVAVSVIEKKLELRRYSTFSIDIPPRENIAVELKLLKSQGASGTLPDLAIQLIKDVRVEGDDFIITVHNIGDGPARNFSVQVLDRDGAVIDAQTIDNLPAPTDFVPKTIDLRFSLHGRAWKKVVLDRENKVEEILEENNEVVKEE